MLGFAGLCGVLAVAVGLTVGAAVAGRAVWAGFFAFAATGYALFLAMIILRTL